MSGLTFDLSIDGIPGVTAHMQGLAEYQLSDLAFDIGALLESSTAERIASEKQSADGTPWPAWSADYAATRHGGHSLLMNEGELLNSIQNFSTGDEVRVGTPLIYGALQHEGGAAIGKPQFLARPFLGISADDEDEIRALVIGDLNEVMQ